MQCPAHSLHQRLAQPSQRASREPAIVNCSNLIDQQVGLSPQLTRRRDTEPQWFGVFNQPGGQGDDECGGMTHVQQNLRLRDQHGPHLARFGAAPRVKVSEPYLAPWDYISCKYLMAISSR